MNVNVAFDNIINKYPFDGSRKELEEYLKLKEEQLELLRTTSPTYNSYYKKEIKEYFESETK